MLDYVFDTLRKASEATVQVQSDLFKQFTQQWFSAPAGMPDASPVWARNFQRRWAGLTVEALHKHRESLDGMYRSGIEMIEQSFRVMEARSPDDYRRMTEDLWRKMFEVFKSQSETQLRDFQNLAEKSFEMAGKPEARA